ncbi:MAG: hypothetical protein ACLFWM_09070 [Actinomycetota bacterium]
MTVPASHLDTGLLCPFDLTVDRIGAFANAEIADHPVYEGLELQWFDDPSHGTGMLAFLSRRADRRVDYYVGPSLRLDRSGYEIGGGTGLWVETAFDAATLQVTEEGAVADVRFQDAEGRTIEVSFDDRDRGRRRPAELLAPFGSDVENPVSLLLVYMHGFDLLRKGRTPPRILIEGRAAATGSLPGSFLHRRHLIKAASPLTVATLCRQRSGPLPPVDVSAPGSVRVDDSGGGIAGMTAEDRDASASFTLDPPLPPLGRLADGEPALGEWQVDVDGAPLTGGTWHGRRRDTQVDLALDVTRPWTPPAGLPPVMRVVTRVIPVFRRWPTSYRWTAQVRLDQTPAAMTSRWERTGEGGSESYRRATGS